MSVVPSENHIPTYGGAAQEPIERTTYAAQLVAGSASALTALPFPEGMRPQAGKFAAERL
jgi:hypothetical protein